ncbi:hypothetical protein N0V84_005294 [Fusarium piperis]|uniref:Uncharacterized protein n=1 Tax=Fusarium piperis TaxID=1435070 RepID=A0A9W9BQE4_9HYPO|nr:hypothetical protein N0V84_005294 [Fusarium piperis]
MAVLASQRVLSCKTLVHLELSSFTFAGGSIGQYAYFSRPVFNPSPKTGTPLAPRYGPEKATILRNPNGVVPITVKDKVLSPNPQGISVGEARGFNDSGFNGDGTELTTYFGSDIGSCNVHLQTGVVRRLTNHPEYPNPLVFSPDNKWMTVMYTRGSGRNTFIAGMRWIPPLVDILPASCCKNGLRRFFHPYLLDFYGDCGDYYCQKIKGDNNGVPGSGATNGPEWNGMADPRCPGSPAPVEEHSDTIPWGVPYVPSSYVTLKAGLAGGIYTLYVKASGEAKVNIAWGKAPEIGTVSDVYRNYSLDGEGFIIGNESVTGSVERLADFLSDWHPDIRQAGAVKGTKKTSPGGFHVSIDIMINDLTTNLDGIEWRSPQSGTWVGWGKS